MEPYNNATIISIAQLIIEGVSHSDNPINDEDEGQYAIPINNRNNQPIPPMARSKNIIAVDHLISLALILPSNLVVPDFIRSCNLMIFLWVSCVLRRMN